jgi:catecholate siderophore receptor
MSKIQQILPPANVTQLAIAAALCLAGTSAFAQAGTTLNTVNVTSSTEAPVKTDNASSAKFTAPLVDTPKTVHG